MRIHGHRYRIHMVDESPPKGVPAELEEDPDVTEIDEEWQAALVSILATWETAVIPDWTSQLTDAVVEARASGNPDDLVELEVDSDDAADALDDEMSQMADTAADTAVSELDDVGIVIVPVVPAPTSITATAKRLASYDAKRVALAAAFKALTLDRESITDKEMTKRLRGFLGEMSVSGSRTVLGWALTDVQNASRLLSFQSGPLLDLYASEVLDTNSCAPCRKIDGTWLCDSTDTTKADELYPSGTYIDCLGGPRCRGLIVARARAEP